MTVPRSPSSLLRTPLHAAHLALGAKTMPFGGYDMPLQYAGIVAEHEAVRCAAGVFDTCHMGEIELVGRDELPWSSVS